LTKKNSIKKAFKWVFIGFSLFFIGMLSFLSLHDYLTGGGGTAQVAELCAKYGFLASPECW
jgi:hypothetical protein